MMGEVGSKKWNSTADAVLGIALLLATGIGGYWANQMDQRNAAQDAQLDDHSYRIRGNEKDIEYAIQRFELIDEKIGRIDKKLDTLIEVTRKQ